MERTAVSYNIRPLIYSDWILSMELHLTISCRQSADWVMTYTESISRLAENMLPVRQHIPWNSIDDVELDQQMWNLFPWTPFTLYLCLSSASAKPLCFAWLLWTVFSRHVINTIGTFEVSSLVLRLQSFMCFISYTTRGLRWYRIIMNVINLNLWIPRLLFRLFYVGL